ncbi:MAG: HAMP domain-containing histidine kinase [Treponema sp.]|uniref:HAMP domain-containing sensor histidine kinase n=1 Tax=Treponema sp. TaxID=166 RepID=UPI0025F84369|nr:HAMP domain-containing sensor histidine kinase [Treponema sp.]MBQ9281545.1 HAMP domain-containing histidine kinase [Treponema sp.]
MKIKTQLRIFLLGVILVPLLAVTALPAYHYLTRPDRMLFDGYKQIRSMDELPLSQRDLRVFRQLIHTLPPNVEYIILANHGTILHTTIPDFSNLSKISMQQLFQYMNETSDKYFYQLSSPPLENKADDILFISRINRDTKHKKDGFTRMLTSLLVFIMLFELFCIILIVMISQTISRSITLLSKNTERIAGGELDVPLDFVKNSKSDNEITRLTENLDKMRLTLKDDAERRTKFIMGISHDLRTPVAVIKGYTEAMSDGFYDNPLEMKKSLGIISSKTEQLETMVNTLINFVKLNQTDWVQQLKKQKIAPVLEEFSKTAVTTGGIFKRKVTAEVSVSEELEIPFDKELIQRTLENLFSNALRYTNENDSIAIRAYEEEEKIYFKIKDSGIGIAQENLEKIFDMFYRASSSRREEGMGIGLATVMTIIKAHGWKISVDSELGKGSEFIIEIPLKN